MNLSSANLKIENMHNSIIKNICHFEDNDPDHFISLSKDSELIEWIIVFSNEIVIKGMYINKFNIKSRNIIYLLKHFDKFNIISRLFQYL